MPFPIVPGDSDRVGDSVGAMGLELGRTSGEPLAEAGMSLHLAVSTVTQYLGWDIIQKRG
jgi:hypothetical protein